MPLLRHAATHASTLQQHSLPYQQQYFHLYYLLAYSNPQWPYYPRSPRQKWHQQQRQQQSRTRKHAFHTTSRLQDKQIDNAQNHYEALKLEPGATPAEVKKSFYALSKNHHPDLHPTSDRPAASRRFMRISEAYAVLSVPAKRHAYDRDTLHLNRQQGRRHHPTTGSYHSANNPAGGRPASGLSRRRGAFQGPPPSFFRSGGWGAHGAKRKTAHEDSTGFGSGSGSGPGGSNANSNGGTGTGTGTMGGMGPGQDPFKSGHEDDVPRHFDRAGHERTGRRGDARRAARQQQEEWENAMRDENGQKKVAEVERERGIAGMFFVIGGVLLLSFLGPFAVGRLFGGWGGGSGGGGGGGERRKTTRAKKAAVENG